MSENVGVGNSAEPTVIHLRATDKLFLVAWDDKPLPELAEEIREWRKSESLVFDRYPLFTIIKDDADSIYLIKR